MSRCGCEKAPAAQEEGIEPVAVPEGEPTPTVATLTDCGCNNFPAGLGTVTFGANISVSGLITGGGASGIKVLSDGKVGIGTPNPGWRLDITSGSNGDGIQLNGSSGSAYSPGLRFADAGTFKGSLGVALTGNAWITGTTVGDTVLRSESRLIFASGGNNGRIYITSDGKVGVGATGPTDKLEVQNPASDWQITVFRTSKSNVYLTLGASDAVARIQAIQLNTWVGKPLVLQPNGGNVGIGTDAPAQKLDVVGSARFTGSVSAANNLKVYDSGWFAVSAANQYTKDHGLGGDPRGIIVYFSMVSSPGANDTVSAAGPAARHDFAGSDYGAFAWLPNRSQLIVRAGNQVGWSGSWRTSGYYKIVAWR